MTTVLEPISSHKNAKTHHSKKKEEQTSIPLGEIHSLFERDYSPKEKKWIKIAREVSDEFSKTAAERYKKLQHPRPQLRRLSESGLGALLVREEAGGGGGNWTLALDVIREIAAGDGSLGVLTMHHYLAVHGIRWLPEPIRSKREKEIVEDKIWIGNGGVNPLDPDTIATPIGNGKFLLNGKKTFCTGGAVSDRVGLAARRSDTGELIHVFISPDRKGIKTGGDWDGAVGLPLADSGSFTYENVEIDENEFVSRGEFGSHLLSQSTRAPKFSHLGFDNVYLGIAIGALRAAREYIHTTTRPWLNSGVDKAINDPHIIFQFGELWARVEAALAVSNQAAARAQAIMDHPEKDLTDRERGEVAVAIAAFKAVAQPITLEVTSKILELMGARSVSAKYGFDRFWRDARTYSLHHSFNYKVHEVGEYALKGVFPPVTFYS